MITIEQNIAQNQTEDGDALVPIRGNTYAVREQLKALFGKWNANDKVWEVPASHAAEARTLVAAQPPQQPRLDIRDWVPVKGNTYPVKDVLKAQFGARWDAPIKAWIVAPDKISAAQAIVPAAPHIRSSSHSHSTSSPTKRCWECGCEFTFAQSKKGDGDWGDSYCGC